MPSLTVKQIEEILPQRYPFLLIDRVLDYKENDFLIAIKNITGNEWALGDGQGQLDKFPECLMIESALQAAIILYHKSKNFPGENPAYLIGKFQFQLHASIDVGSVLQISVIAEKLMRSAGYTNIKLRNENEEIATLDIFFSVKR